MIDRLPEQDIVIVNWNSGDQLRVCLYSVQQSCVTEFLISRVVVVDNASADGSADGLESMAAPLMVIKNTQNRGFAAACNQGAKDSESDYLLFLNPDVRLFSNSLAVPVTFMEQPENEQVGIVGIQLVDDSGRVARTCVRFPTPGGFLWKIFGLDKIFTRLFPSHFMREWNHTETRVVDHVMGAFFLVRKSVFERLGGFDERFFVYLEDLDFSYRAYRAGWKSVYLATAQAYHAGGGTSKNIKARRLFYSLRSRIIYSHKHFSRQGAIAVTLGTLFVEPCTRIIWAAVRLSGKEVVDTIKGYFMLWRDIRSVMTKGKRGVM